MPAKKSNQKNKESNIADHMIIQSEIADFVKILVPKSVSESKINTLLMSQYLLNKLLHKRAKVNMKFTAIYLGKDQNFLIIDIGRFKQLQKEEKIQKVVVKQQSSTGKKTQEQQSIWFVVKQKTKVLLSFEENDYQKSKFKGNALQQESKHNINNNKHIIFGSKAELEDIKSGIYSSLFNRTQYLKNGLGPLKGILVSGFSGTGKSSIVRAAVSQIKVSNEQITVKTISSIKLLSKVVGGAEQFINSTFTQVKSSQPSVLIIEDLHLLFSKKQINSHTTTLAALLAELDAINEQRVIVVATTNSEQELVSEIKGSGKFEKQISLNLPNHHERLEILKGFVDGVNQCSEQQEILSQEDMKALNLRMNGFSIGEIKQIIRQAYSKCDKQKLTKSDIQAVLKSFKPAEVKQLIVEVPQVFWKDIGGYENVKSQIRKVTQLPLKHPQAFKRFGIDPIKGIMLYGPPGCSKTMMAKAIATESKLNFIGVKGPELFSKYVGDSEKAIRNIFKRARACSPCIIFFDEIDAIASQRSSNTQVSDRVLCQLLNEMDGIQGLKQVIIIAATNRPQILDNALMRPGRFDYMVYISPPDIEARQQIFNIYLSKSQTCTEKNQIQNLSKQLAAKTQGYTGAQISLVCRQGALMALQQDINCQSVNMLHYQTALKKIRKRLSKQTISKYTNFEANLKY